MPVRVASRNAAELEPMRIRHGIFLFLLLAAAVTQSAHAQQSPESSGENLPDKPMPQTPPAASPAVTHRFWDNENLLLFGAVAAGRGFDYASTMDLRRRGLNEIFLTNAIVDNHPLFIGIEAAATAASIGVSYAFHVTGHHRLERWTSAVHFGVATGGAIRNYALKSP
jgi:hypothetical protein